VPESIHQFLFLFSDRGTPRTYRHMSGFSSHAFKWTNAAGEGFWIKLHYKPEEGVKSFTREEAAETTKRDGDHATRDLHTHIASGKVAAWKAYVQIMPLHEGAKYKWNIFDVTKVWPHRDYPLFEYGRLVLNRNPLNYFAEVEQSAFSPSHLVPGVEPSPDRMLQGRLFSYPDTHRYRLGANYLQIPINCPYNKVTTHQRDGFMAVLGNGGSEENYEPSSVSGTPKVDPAAAIKTYYVDDWVAHFPHTHVCSDFEQPGAFFRVVLGDKERENLVGNIVTHLGQTRKPIQARMVALLTRVDTGLGRRVAEGLARRAAL